MTRESQSERVARVLRDRIEISDYDPRWPSLFREEERLLLDLIPANLLRRIEHVGSTSIPGLAAKPVIDMLIEVNSVVRTRDEIVPLLEARGYDTFWSPSRGENEGPFYPFCIKRNETGQRTHHLHMIEPGFPHSNMLPFRNYLLAHPESAQRYAALKQRLASEHPADRLAYCNGKEEFIAGILALCPPWQET